MTIWNDKRTAPGVVTDSRTGASQHISVGLGAKYGIPRPKLDKPDGHEVAKGGVKPAPRPQPKAHGKH